MSESSKSHSSVVDLVWMKLWFDSDLEAAETVGMKLVKEEVRCVVWNMAATLGFQTNGVPGNACRLLERYFYTWFKSYSQFPSGSVQRASLESVQNRFLIIVASCIQLSAKMSTADACCSPTVVRAALTCKGVRCTPKDIVQTEAEVYGMLGYRIPLLTSVDIGEMLAHEIGINIDLNIEVALLVDMAEYVRNIVESKMRWAATGSSTSTAGGVRTLHLAAGAVVVVARLERSHTQNSALTKSERNSIAATKVGHLARLVNIPFSYLTCLSDVIIAAIKEEHLQRKSKPLILKRKMID